MRRLSLSDRFAIEAERLQIREGTDRPMPFVAHGRDPEIGLDCAGLLIVAARRAGLAPDDMAYALVPGADWWAPMVRVVESVADPLPAGEGWTRGDLLGFRFKGLRQHLAIYLGSGMVIDARSDATLRRVVVAPLDSDHRKMVAQAWRLREAA